MEDGLLAIFFFWLADPLAPDYYARLHRLTQGSYNVLALFSNLSLSALIPKQFAYKSSFFSKRETSFIEDIASLFLGTTLVQV